MLCPTPEQMAAVNCACRWLSSQHLHFLQGYQEVQVGWLPGARGEG